MMLKKDVTRTMEVYRTPIIDDWELVQVQWRDSPIDFHWAIMRTGDFDPMFAKAVKPSSFHFPALQRRYKKTKHVEKPMPILVSNKNLASLLSTGIWNFDFWRPKKVQKNIPRDHTLVLLCVYDHYWADRNGVTLQVPRDVYLTEYDGWNIQAIADDPSLQTSRRSYVPGNGDGIHVHYTPGSPEEAEELYEMGLERSRVIVDRLGIGKYRDANAQ